MRLWWPEKPREGGDSYGYRRQSLGMLGALTRKGVIEDPGARLVVIACSPARFNRSHYEKNGPRTVVLFTNWEAADMFPAQVECANQADLVIVISSFNVETFRRNITPPVELAHLGLGPEFHPRHRIPTKNEPWRWLWVGAPSMRKGWDRLTGGLDPSARGGVWYQKGWHARSDVELVMKWSQHEGGGITRTGNVIYDTRRLSDAELLSLYYSAHGFVLPSYGEGCGLTLMEAIATGCPSIYVPWGGVTDFACGWPVEFDWVETQPEWKWAGGIQTKVSRVRTQSLHDQMRSVMADQERSFDLGYRNGLSIEKRFSWDTCAEEFLGAIVKHFPWAAGEGDGRL